MQLKLLILTAALSALTSTMPTTDSGLFQIRGTKIGDVYLDGRHATDLQVTGDCVLIPIFGGNRVNHQKSTRCRFYRHNTNGIGRFLAKDHIGGVRDAGLVGTGGFQNTAEQLWAYTCWFG